MAVSTSSVEYPELPKAHTGSGPQLFEFERHRSRGFARLPLEDELPVFLDLENRTSVFNGHSVGAEIDPPKMDLASRHRV